MLRKSTIIAIAGSFIVVGIGLSTVGVALGGRTSVSISSLMEFSDPIFAKEYRESIPELESELVKGIDYTTNLDTGEVSKKVWEKLSAFTDLKIDVGTVDIHILAGEEYEIDVDIKGHVDLGYRIEDGELYVRQENLKDYKQRESLKNNMNDGTVTIMIPKGITLGEVTLNLGVGEGIIENIEAGELELTNGVGDMKVKDVIGDKVDITGGVGDVTVERLKAKDTIFNNGVGSLNVIGLMSEGLETSMGIGDASIQGDIKGDIDISGGLGGLELELKGDEKDYNYFISRGGGRITINEMNEFGLEDVKLKNDGKYDIEIEAGLGEIVIKTNK